MAGWGSWAWMAGGLGLLGLELFFIDTGFYLVFLGLSAIAVGLCALGLGIAAPSLQWMLFGIFALVSVFTFRRKLYERIHRGGPEIPEGVSGEWALASERIEPGATGRVELRGTHWSARNVGEKPIEAGSRAQVVQAESLVLLIRT